MAEASARMHLRDHVRDDDVDLSIKVGIATPLSFSNDMT
jgi:DNA replicative helicase MCM subunit Mcm2 (Cdc46/Mcm family)